MESIKIIQDITGEEFVVQRGVSHTFIDQIYELSHDSDGDLQRFTDDTRRFISQEAIQKWLQDTSRQVYILTSQQHPEVLAGLAWLREDDSVHHLDIKQDDTYDKIYTIATRLYPGFRGRRLAIPFMEAVQDDYVQKMPAQRCLMFANIHQENIASQKLFEKLGYKPLGTVKNRVVFGKIYL